jgi:hypothetical protein
VSYAHDAFSVATEQRDFHAASLRRKLDRVIDEVDDGLHQQVAVPDYRPCVRKVDVQGYTFVFRNWLVDVANLLHEVRKRHRCRRQGTAELMRASETFQYELGRIAGITFLGLAWRGLSRACGANHKLAAMVTSLG